MVFARGGRRFITMIHDFRDLEHFRKKKILLVNKKKKCANFWVSDFQTADLVTAG